jgi:polyhydroxyalkanoate synthesis regulator phasin
MVDDLRNYLQMAMGITEATTSKAKDVVTALVSQGMSLSAKAVPAPEMMGQVQELADSLVSTSKENHEALVAMIRTETDKAVGRMGFVREDELAALRRHVERLEKQLADVRAAAASAAEPAATPAATPAAESARQETPEPDGATPAAPDAGDVPIKKKKKKIVVEPDA